MPEIGAPDLPAVPRRLVRPLTDEELAVLSHRLEAAQRDRLALAWLEKLRRLLELNRGRFAGRCRQLGMTRSDTARLAEQAVELLTSAGVARSVRPPDLPSVSAALRFLDADAAGLMPRAKLREARRTAEAAVDELASALRGRAAHPASPAAKPMAELCADLHVTHYPPRWCGLAAEPSRLTDSARVVLFSPNPYSLYSLAMSAMLEARGFTVAGIILRSFWTVARVREEINFGYGRFLSKLTRKLVLASDENPQKQGYSMRDLCREAEVTHRSVSRWARERRIPVHVTTNFNATECLQALEALRADYGVFTGGGLIRPPALERCGKGLLSCHPGVLPQYKGVDVAHWPLLEGHPEMVGATVYLMDRGVDTGQVLGQMFVDPAGFVEFGALRNYLAATKAVFLVDVLERLAAGTVTPRRQPKAGRQYYSVHPKLELLMNAALRSASRARE